MKFIEFFKIGWQIHVDSFNKYRELWATYPLEIILLFVGFSVILVYIQVWKEKK